MPTSVQGFDRRLFDVGDGRFAGTRKNQETFDVIAGTTRPVRTSGKIRPVVNLLRIDAASRRFRPQKGSIGGMVCPQMAQISTDFF